MCLLGKDERFVIILYTMGIPEMAWWTLVLLGSDEDEVVFNEVL